MERRNEFNIILIVLESSFLDNLELHRAFCASFLSCQALQLRFINGSVISSKRSYLRVLLLLLLGVALMT